jgi:hypothetical protein
MFLCFRDHMGEAGVLRLGDDEMTAVRYVEILNDDEVMRYLLLS